MNWNYDLHKTIANEYERKATRNAEFRTTENRNEAEPARIWKRNRRQR